MVKFEIKILSLILIFLFTAFVSAKEYNVTFNRDFKEGETLYSQIYNNISNIFGKDAYPDRSTIIKNCTTENICEKYAYHYETICNRTDPFNGRCTLFIKRKINDGCIKYENVTICSSTPIGCFNNKTGRYTNQLQLAGNFFYNLDNSSEWIPMTYGNIILRNASVQFKVQIPSVCKPKYNINKSIIIE